MSSFGASISFEELCVLSECHREFAEMSGNEEKQQSSV